MTKLRLLGVTVLAASGIAGSAMAGTRYISIPTRVGNGADALVRMTNPTSTLGSSDQIPIRYQLSPAYGDKTYLRFDLSAAGITDPTRISAAKLECTLRDVSANAVVVTLRVHALHEADDNWTEKSTGGITWNNAPANNTANGRDMIIGTSSGQCQLLGKFSISLAPPPPSVPTYYTPNGHSYTFTAANVNSFLKTDTDGIVSFALTSETSTGNSHMFVSKEYAVARPYDPPPTLSLEVDEPSHANVAMTPTDSAYIRDAAPDTADSTSLGVRHAPAGGKDKSYLRFDLPAVGVSDWTRVSSARLTIRLDNLTDKAKPKQIRVFGLHEAYDDWSGATTTWNNATANTSKLSDAIDAGKGVLLGTFTVPDSAARHTYYQCTFDCDRLPDFLTQETDGSLTLVLAAGTYSAVWNMHSFHGRTSASPPSLTLSLSPPAGTLMLFR
jgi:hypothetical protein